MRNLIYDKIYRTSLDKIETKYASALKDAKNDSVLVKAILGKKKEEIAKLLKETERKMKKAAKAEDFIEAARLRDEMMDLKKMI